MKGIHQSPQFSLWKINLKIVLAKCWPFCLGIYVSIINECNNSHQSYYSWQIFTYIACKLGLLARTVGYSIIHWMLCDNSCISECRPGSHYWCYYPGALSLTHWGQVMHICVSKLIIISSDNGLSPSQHQTIIWTNAGILLIRPLGRNFSDILIEIHIFLFKEMHLKMLSARWQAFCLSLNELSMLSKEPLQLIWRLSTSRFHLWRPNLQMSCWDKLFLHVKSWILGGEKSIFTIH